MDQAPCHAAIAVDLWWMAPTGLTGCYARAVKADATSANAVALEKDPRSGTPLAVPRQPGAAAPRTRR